MMDVGSTNAATGTGLTRVAIVGSCCTRDAFNSLFVPDYKEHFQVVYEAFQPSFLAIMEPPVAHNPASFRLPSDDYQAWSHHAVLPFELAKPHLLGLVDAQPDIIVFDFYSDIHWGIREVEGSVMSGRSIYTENGVFDGFDVSPRTLTADTAPLLFLRRFRTIARRFGEFARRWLPNTTLVVHQARYATKEEQADGTTRYTRGTKLLRLYSRNLLWAQADQIFMAETGAIAITHKSRLTSASNYPLGGATGPVHYTLDAHNELSYNLRDIARQLPSRSANVEPSGVNSLNLHPNASFSVPGAGWITTSPVFQFHSGCLKVFAENTEGTAYRSAISLPIYIRAADPTRIWISFEYEPAPDDQTLEGDHIVTIRMFDSKPHVNAADALSVLPFSKKELLAHSHDEHHKSSLPPYRVSLPVEIQGNFLRVLFHAPHDAHYTIRNLRIARTLGSFTEGIPGFTPIHTPVKNGFASTVQSFARAAASRGRSESIK